jgi:cytochrome b involved in lipid metabolism
MNELISVIIVNWNGKRWLKDCLSSLQGQTYKNFEIILVDNASSGGTNSVSVEKIFTMDEISKHNSRASCYTVVRGNVYDLTNFKDSHPGGEKAILSICGKDGSSAFEDQHGGQNKPENQLVKLKIGVLSK